jgi:hypothetical protein
MTAQAAIGRRRSALDRARPCAVNTTLKETRHENNRTTLR